MLRVRGDICLEFRGSPLTLPSPAYAAGVRIGYDPCELGVPNQRMGTTLQGHPYVKSGIDMACWNILGQVSGLRFARCSAGCNWNFPWCMGTR